MLLLIYLTVANNNFKNKKSILVVHRDETCDVGSKVKRSENLNPSFVTTSRNGIQSVISHLQPNNNTSGMFYAR